jgi:hypothetical protein
MDDARVTNPLACDLRLRLNCFMGHKSRPWTVDEERKLRSLATTKHPAEIARELNRSEAAVPSSKPKNWRSAKAATAFVDTAHACS